MVDDQVVQGTAVEDGLHVGDELPAHRPVGGVEEDGLLVQQDIGVVGYAVVQGVDVLKQGQPVLVRAYPVQVVGDHTVVIHIEFPPLYFTLGHTKLFHASISIKLSTVSPQWGQVQPSGRSLKAVPGLTSFSGSPCMGSYSWPQPLQTYSFLG